MTINGSKRRRAGRLAPFELSPHWWQPLVERLKQGRVLARLGLAILSAMGIWFATRAWEPPFAHRVGDEYDRPVLSRVSFSQANAAAPNASELTVSTGDPLTTAGVPLTEESIKLLQAEHATWLRVLPLERKIARGGAVLALIAALQSLCGYYIYRRDRRLLGSLRKLTILLVMSPITALLAYWTSHDPWRAEVTPLLLFSMTAAIAYQRDLALVLSLSMALIASVAIGQGLPEFMLLMGLVCAAVLQVRRVRSRRTLIQVGMFTGAAAFAISLGLSAIEGQSLGGAAFKYATYNFAWTVLTGFLMTGLLPFIEGPFGVVTEMRLLELGDVAHPLLHELVRRAPGTYNHSINVASLGEAAADAIGAQGLLVRVGAYFHDIGKMLKPDYFVENQAADANRHDTLAPAMSTLIIIAHIKDGAELGRKHHLPEPIIDFIEQHHGTTLVEYFYRRASERQEADPDLSEVSESAFRYPGPKPQTVEAAVLMVADAVESASRVLVEPTPARIESLVEQIAMKKLLDGQFDECGLTLMQLRTVQDSLVKSLTAVYHGRVKYPDQRTA